MSPHTQTEKANLVGKLKVTKIDFKWKNARLLFEAGCFLIILFDGHNQSDVSLKTLFAQITETTGNRNDSVLEKNAEKAQYCGRYELKVVKMWLMNRYCYIQTTAFSVEPKEPMCSDSGSTPCDRHQPPQKNHMETPALADKPGPIDWSTTTRCRHWTKRHGSKPFAVFIAFVVALLCKRWCCADMSQLRPKHIGHCPPCTAMDVTPCHDAQQNKQTEACQRVPQFPCHVLSYQP